MATRAIVGGEESRLEISMKEAIKNEMLRSDKKRAPRNAPIVYKDNSELNHSHYYVVWNAFEGLDQMVRSSIVYQAVGEAFGPVEGLRTVTAIGLTLAEARQMGIIR